VPEVKSNHKLGGVDSLKSRRYNLMVAGLSSAANVLDILVLMYRIFETRQKFWKLHENVHKKSQQPYRWI